MKINKRIAIPLLSTVLGLAVIGGTSGAVAWYQYNTRANASFVGSSVADSGVLQIKTDTEDWGRDVYDTGSTNENKLLPVTFGNSSITKSQALPTAAHGRPEAGVASVENWELATVGKEFVQYKVYLRALKADATKEEGKSQVALPVYLSKIYLEGATGNRDNEIADALRLHLDVKDGSKFLISSKGETTKLSGKLDLDGDGHDDKVGGLAWDKPISASDIIYGAPDCTQEAWSIAEMECPRGTDGELTNTSSDNLICTTKTGTDNVEITVTVWLEGWETLGTEESAIWNAYKTGGASVHVGMTFDVGKSAFSA